MNPIAQYFWIVFILFHFGSLTAWWNRIQSRIEENPELKEGYRSLYHGYLLFGGLPWLAMGAGLLTGQVSSIFDYLHPGSPNPFVFGWWCLNAVLLLLGTWWIFLGGGAEKLAKHPGCFMVPHWPAGKLKVYWVVVAVWNVVIAVMLYLWGGAIPKPGSAMPFAVPPGWLAGLFPFFFVGLWLLICFMTSAMGGWMSLAEHYVSAEPMGTPQLQFRSGSFGFTSYGGILNLGAGADGLHLSVFFLFRLKHPPLMIPWSDIGVNIKKGWLGNRVEITFAKCPGVELQIGEALAQDLAKESNGAFDLPPFAA